MEASAVRHCKPSKGVVFFQPGTQGDQITKKENRRHNSAATTVRYARNVPEICCRVFFNQSCLAADGGSSKGSSSTSPAECQFLQFT